METKELDGVVEQALAQAGQVDLSWIQPPPETDGWTLAPDALRFVTKLVELLKPRHILEMGSGLSTRVLSHAAATVGSDCVISSVDHDPQYNWESSRVAGAEVPANVKFQLAPLVVREFGGKLLGAYLIQPSKFASPHPVDLVVIDGPPVNLGGREGTLYQLMDYAQQATLVLLDDSKRPEEKAALQAWSDNLGDVISVRQLPGFTKGMAAVVIHKPVRTKDQWAHRFSLTRRELEGIVPRHETVIIAGDDWWGQELALDRKVLPFTERDGQYWGPPADETSAMSELDRLKSLGGRSFILGWPNFWWKTHYPALMARLGEDGRRVLDNDRVVLFDLR